MSFTTPGSTEPDGFASFILRADRSLSPIENAASFTAGAGVFLLMALGVLQILLRSLFNSPIVGYIDLVELSMAILAFLGTAYCQRLGGHIRMDILVGHLEGRLLWFVESVGTLLALFIIGVIIWFGWDHFLRAYELGDTSIDAEFPVWPSKLLVPVAFAIWWLRLAIQLVGSLRLMINPSLEPAGVLLHKDAAQLAQEEIRESLGENKGADR
ncbi:TRAP transporter small permease [Nisaea sp.]|uniref:TRAP transporter small permease subunit n=1 Tax=Nisaea sp. TaxID=2024842 RepID=UPI002B26B57F|nr:TRAP transporter small permease [Nisaea sp.]